MGRTNVERNDEFRRTVTVIRFVFVHGLLVEGQRVVGGGEVWRCGGGDRTESGSRARSPSAVAEVLAEWLEAHRR